MIALVTWGIVILGVLFHASSARIGSLFWTYQNAGRSWLAGIDLYRYRGFAVDQGSYVYSPLAAALFVPFTLLGNTVGGIIWRLLSTTLFLGAVWSWLKLQLHHGISRGKYGAVFLLLIPFSIGNINSGQANLLIISLVMFGIINADLGRWTFSALCLALATYYKIYPISCGLLLALVFPRQMTWRLFVALLALGCLSLILQRPSYVVQEYSHWMMNRATDDRHMAPIRMAPRDLMLLLRFLGCSVNAHVYMAIQICGGLAIALFCVAGRLKQWSVKRLMVGLFSLLSCWMVLLGPATEPATYVLLAPAVVLAFIHGLSLPTPRLLRVILLLAFALLLSALGFNSFGEFDRNPFQVFQPAGALLFSIYVVLWLMDSSLWISIPQDLEPSLVEQAQPV